MILLTILTINNNLVKLWLTMLIVSIAYFSIITASLVTMTLIFCSTSLYKREIGYSRTLWEGKIDKWNLPIEDSIAICYMNIKFDSNRFDRDKECGFIYIPNGILHIDDLAA